ncbi:MAG: hypothetical protein GY898_19650 [Proteobacteria bacterium]|nr:hypothetical protein [Pseudomonadota bacterium]
MRLTPIVLLAALTLLTASTASAYPLRVAAGANDAALIMDPFFNVRVVPADDDMVGTFAETEPVPVDGRLGWYLQTSRLENLRDLESPAEPELWLGDELVPGVIEEETVGDFVWLWFTPEEPLEADADYLFEYGDEADMTVEFATGPEDLGSIGVDDAPTVDLSVTWSGARPGGQPSMTINLTIGADRESEGSSRLSVMRVFKEDGELHDVIPVGIDRTSFAWWQEFPGVGTSKPDEVCVTVIHENGYGEQGDPVEACIEPQRANGCSVVDGAPGAAGSLAGLLLALGFAVRRKSR